MAGTFYLIGVGPGDPELMTIKGANILRSVDIVAFPQKPGTDSLALKIAAPHLRNDVEQMPIILPMEKSRHPARNVYDKASLQIGEKLDEGICVAYLCEGDPFFYGSAMYLFARLIRQYDVQIIPGISSLNAAASAIKRPLAARDEILKILPATLDDETLLKELEGAEAAAIIKVGRNFDRIKNVIIKSGHANGAVVIEYASRSSETIRPLNSLDTRELPWELSYFSIILCYGGQEEWGRKVLSKGGIDQ